MELKRLKCPTCGASIDGNTIDLTKKTAKCPACDETFIIEQAESFAKVEVDKTKDIANYRRNLALATEKDDAESIKRYAEKILDILPEDYEAEYFYAYANAKIGDSRYLYDFYNDFDKEYTEESCMRVAEHIVNHGELRDNVLIEKYIKNLKFSSDSYLSYYKQVFNDKLSKEELYDDITRDVFICHRSIDGKVAERIVKELEDDGNKCWISSRNLRPNDNENYWDNIKRAIKSCRIFLVVSSRDAMLSTDVKKEMAFAKDLNKQRLEVKIDNKEHTAFFKDFFDGCKWIEGENFSEITKRVAGLLFQELCADSKIAVEKNKSLESEKNSYSEGLEIVDGILKGIGTCKDKDIIIPYGVTEIDSKAFCHFFYVDFESIVIPNSVKKIGDFAFCLCEHLRKIVIPDGVKYIGDCAFSSCYNIKKIVIPDSVLELGYGVFKDCLELTEIEIGCGVKEIPSGTFEGCENLKKITYHEGTHIQYYGNFEFDNRNLDPEFDYASIPEYPKIETVNFIGNIKGWINDPLCFYLEYEPGIYIKKKYTLLINGQALTEMYIPDDVEVLNEDVFLGCLELKKVAFGKGLREIGSSLFTYNDKLEQVVFIDKDSKWQILKHNYNSDKDEFVDTIEVSKFTSKELRELIEKYFNCKWKKIIKSNI